MKRIYHLKLMLLSLFLIATGSSSTFANISNVGCNQNVVNQDLITKGKITDVMVVSCITALLPSRCHHHRFDELDEVLKQQDQYVAKRFMKIDILKQQLEQTQDTVRMLGLLDDLYIEYYTFRFDSAIIYINKLDTLARKSHDAYYLQKCGIHQIVEYATGGYYIESLKMIDSFDPNKLDPRLVYEYYYAVYQAYLYLEQYLSGTKNQAEYTKKSEAVKLKIIQLCQDPYYKKSIIKPTCVANYMKGHHAYDQKNYKRAAAYFTACLDGCEVNERLYAMSAISVAICNLHLNETEKFEEYAAKAAISDIKSSLKENSALQYLALYLNENYPNEIERSERYLSKSLEDANFYNNNLRKIQIAGLTPKILDAYKKEMQRQNKLLLGIQLVIVIILSVLLYAFLSLRKKRNLIDRQRLTLEASNAKVNQLNLQLSEANTQQLSANEELREANQLREQQLHLFLDLCVANTNKLENYRALVMRKVKVHQAEDLLKYSNTTALAEQESSEFIAKFDRAFLSLYPKFAKQINLLLREDAQLVQKEPQRLTPELRILAMIRLGVTESSAIATLLFYTPQTIYNYRSTLKRRAIDRDTFESQIAKMSCIETPPHA